MDHQFANIFLGKKRLCPSLQPASPLASRVASEQNSVGLLALISLTLFGFSPSSNYFSFGHFCAFFPVLFVLYPGTHKGPALSKTPHEHKEDEDAFLFSFGDKGLRSHLHLRIPSIMIPCLVPFRTAVFLTKGPKGRCSP